VYLESVREPEIAKSPVALQSRCLEKSCLKGLGQDTQGLFEEGIKPEPKAWERIVVHSELVPTEQDHILVDSMMSQSWLAGGLLGWASWLWDTG